MKKIGITGGIGSGKSYLCSRLAALGIPVYNCDDEAKRLMHTDLTLRRQLTELIGPDTYNADGTLNKPVVADFLFSSTDNAKRINAVVHPRVLADFNTWADSQPQTSTTVVMESAILFESGFDKSVDLTVAVYAPETIRLARAMRRDAASEEQIRRRMANQMNDEEKRRLADFVFYNDNEQDFLQRFQTFFNRYFVQNQILR